MSNVVQLKVVKAIKNDTRIENGRAHRRLYNAIKKLEKYGCVPEIAECLETMTISYLELSRKVRKGE